MKMALVALYGTAGHATRQHADTQTRSARDVLFLLCPTGTVSGDDNLMQCSGGLDNGRFQNMSWARDSNWKPLAPRTKLLAYALSSKRTRQSGQGTLQVIDHRGYAT
jgi:hypothetical protein